MSEVKSGVQSSTNGGLLYVHHRRLHGRKASSLWGITRLIVVLLIKLREKLAGKLFE